MWKTVLITAALSALIGCSRGTEESSPAPSAATIPTQDEIDALMAEGIEPIARRLAVTDYYLHYHLMRETGMFEALGGEEQAIAALIAIGEAHERNVRRGEQQVPRMIPAAFTGGGIGAGMYGFGTAAVASMAANYVVQEMSRLEAEAGARGVEGIFDEATQAPEYALHEETPDTYRDKDGKEHRHEEKTTFDADKDKATVTTESKGSKSTIQIDKDGTLSFESDVYKDGVEGKIKAKVRMDKCPDPEGKLTIRIDVESRMGVFGKPGTGGSVKAEFRYERWLDDDARLIDTADGKESTSHIEIRGSERGKTPQRLERTSGISRGGDAWTNVNTQEGFSIFQADEAKRAGDAIDDAHVSLVIVAEMMLRLMGKNAPWESGRCVKLEVTTDPEKRTGADPGITYRIEAKPRATDDGLPTEGTVRATLSGDSSLDPADKKVDADAQFQYDNPKEKDKKASIDFEARSKRGVGRATANFDTEEKNSYRIESALCEGGGRETMDVCDVTEPFSVTFCGGTATVRHTPSGEKGGAFDFRFTSPHGHAQNTGSYTLSGEKEKLTATYVNKPVCFTAGGQTHCHAAPSSSVTWTKIDDCED